MILQINRVKHTGSASQTRAELFSRSIVDVMFRLSGHLFTSSQAKPTQWRLEKPGVPTTIKSNIRAAKILRELRSKIITKINKECHFSSSLVLLYPELENTAPGDSLIPSVSTKGK